MTRNSRRLQKAVQAIFNDYREKASCSGQVYQNAACGCENALQMWRGPKGDKGDQGPQGPKGDNAGSFLVDAEFVVDPEGQEPGAYLKLVLIDVAQQEQVVYVDLSYLTDIYTGGNGISITDMVVAARLGAGLTFDANGNIASAYQFCDGLDETSNVVKVRLDSSNHILGFASGTCGGLTASVGLAPSATGVNLVLTGADGTVLSTVPLNGSDGITVQKNAQTGGFTWLANPSGLVSSDSGNQLSVSQTDNKLYVGGNTLSYTFGTGAFTLKDSSGATLSSVTVPSAVRMLEDMELRTDDGVYLHLTYLRDNGLRAYQDVSLDGLLCHDTETLDDSTAAYSKSVPSGNWQTASINEIGGRTVVWNQLVQDYYNCTGGTASYDATEQTVTYTVSTPSTTNGMRINYLCGSDKTEDGHKYLIAVDVLAPHAIEQLFFYRITTTTNHKFNQFDGVNTANAWTTMTRIYTGSATGLPLSYAQIMIYNSTRDGFVAGDVVKFRNFVWLDLTQMFGSGNEPATVAEFEAMFPSIDPTYNAGELRSAGVTEVVREGENIMPPPAAGTTTINGLTAVSDGKGTITFSGTAASFTSFRFDVPEFTIPLSGTLGGSHQFFANNSFATSLSSINFCYNNTVIDSWGLGSKNRTSRSYSTMGGRLCNNWRVTINNTATIDGTIAPAFVNDTGSAVARYNFKEYLRATLPVPAAIQAFPGYGWSAGSVYNYVDYERKVYVQNVAMATFDGSADEGWALTSPASTTRQAFLSSGYLQSTKAYLQIINDKGILVNISSQDSPAEANIITMRSTSYEATYLYIFVPPSILSGIDAFKAWLAANPITITYALATPIETDISSLLTDSTIEVEPGGTLTFKNQHGDDFRLPVPNSETFIYEHPWVFEDCIKELVWKELEPYSSSIADVSASFSCGSDYTWYISALHPWCDTESDDCGGTVYSAPAVMPSLGTDIVMPAKILEKYSSVDIVISTAPISIVTTDTSPTEFKYVTDAAHADAPYMAYELYSPYGAYYSFISDEEWAAASVGDLVELVSGRNVVEEHRAFKGAGNFDGSQLPPMQQCPLSDIPFRVFVVKETDSVIPDWPTGDIHIRVLQREGVEIPVTPTTLTLTTTDVSGTTHEQEIDMSCILDIVDDKFGDLSPVAMSGSFNDLTDTPTNHVTTDTNQTITGVKTFGAGVYGNAVAMSAGAIDVSAGTVFTKTIAANTTISFSNVPAAPATACVTLILTNGGSKTVTWPSSVKWSGGTAPNLTASGVDVLTFLTVNGGTTWYGTVNSLGAA